MTWQDSAVGDHYYDHDHEQVPPHHDSSAPSEILVLQPNPEMRTRSGRNRGKFVLAIKCHLFVSTL